MKNHSLPKSEILKSKKEFQKIFSTGVKFQNNKLTAFVCFDNHQSAAFTVSKSLGNAVKRNRVKRWMREAYRTNKNLLRKNIKIILLVREWDDEIDFSSLKNSLIKIFNEINRYDKHSDKESNYLSH